jgi:proteasome lid subunit RPN8/RPN11
MRVLMLLLALNGPKEEIACNDAVLAQAWTLLAAARYGQSARERAAFVVFDGRTFSFVSWPDHASPYAARYAGAIPQHTVAIVHTHPNARPLPSPEDEETARRLGLPVYVLTRTMIARTDAKRVWEGDWQPGGAGARNACGRP